MITRTPWKQVAPVPSVIAPIPGGCMFTCRSVQSVDPPPGHGDANYAVGLSYTGDVDTPNGPMFDQAGVVPVAGRPEFPWLCDPLETYFVEEDGKVHGVYPAAIISGKVYLLCAERIHAEPCDGGA